MIPLIPKHWCLIGMAACLIAGFAGGWTVRDWKADSAALAQTVRAEKERDRLMNKADAASESYEALRAEMTPAHTETRNTIREIYRNVEVPADCRIPDDAGRMLEAARIRANAAVTGQSAPAMPDHPAHP